MRIIGAIAISIAVLGVAAVAAIAHTDAGPTAAEPAQQGAMAMPMGMDMSGQASTAALPASKLALARVATARFATDLGAAKAAGYAILTQKMPGMGYHFINPSVKGFDVRKPPILVYERNGAKWQLGALEWVFPKKPATPPLAGATYGSFPAACHYKDGTWTPEPDAAACAATSPSSGSQLNFWHPQLVTMHVWLWYPNPSGLYASTNPLVGSFG